MSESERATAAETVSEFTTKNRLRSLFEARDEAADKIRNRSKAETELIRRGIEQEAARRYVDRQIKESVRSYCFECEPLLQNTDAGYELLTDVVVGEIQVPDRSRGKELLSVDIADDLIEDNIIQLQGIESYLSVDAVSVKYGGQEKTRQGIQYNTTTQQMAISTEVSETVFRQLNELLADLGIGLEVETDTKESEFEYSDLI